MLDSSQRMCFYKTKASDYQNTESNFKKTSHMKSFTTAGSTGFREQALSKMKIVSSNIKNVRYLGFSEFYSNNSLQNSSYCYSFPQAKRFITYDTVTDKMYDVPQVISYRKAGIGIGLRKDRRPKVGACSPPPDTYSIPTCFDDNLSHRRGNTFGDKLENKIDPDKIPPGPGAYSIRTQENKKLIPIRIRSRRGFFYEDELKKRIHCVSMQKYHPDDKLEHNQRFTNITFGRGNKISCENIYVKNFPGPGAYEIIGCFDKGYKKNPVLN